MSSFIKTNSVNIIIPKKPDTRFEVIPEVLKKISSIQKVKESSTIYKKELEAIKINLLNKIFEIIKTDTIITDLRDKSRLLHNLYNYIDFDNLTINNKYQEDNTLEKIAKSILKKIKDIFFGNFIPIKCKRVILPFYLQTENIIQLFKTILNTTITETDIQTNIINYYNENKYTILCKDGKEYMRFQEEKYDIPLNKINKIYDKLIQEKLTEDISLFNAYNEKKYIIEEIEISTEYKFKISDNYIKIVYRVTITHIHEEVCSDKMILEGI